MSSRTQRFLPTKIQRNRHAPRTKPEQFDEVIREAFDFSRKISKKSAFDKEADHFIRETYQGHIEKRRKAALRRSLNNILQRKAPTDKKDAATSNNRQIQLTFDDVATSDHRQIQQAHEQAATPNQRQIQLDPEDAAIAWIELNAPMASYTKMEQQSHVLFAAAIWMLDRITKQENWRRKLFRLLPRNEHEIEEFHEPDVWDCSYDYDLIASVVNVLYYRNLNVDRKQPIDASTIDGFEKRLDLYEDNPYALTSEYAATHQLPDDWRTAPYTPSHDAPSADDNRERFKALLALIPQDEIDDIVDQFKALLGDWVDRFYEGLAAISKERELLDQQKARIAEEHNTLVDELEVLIDAFEDKRRSKTVKKNGKSDKGKGNKQGTGSLLMGTPAVNPLLVNPTKQNPLLANAMKGSLPGIEAFIKSQSMGQSARPTGAGVSKNAGKNVGMNVSMNTGMRSVANRFGFSPSVFSPFDDRLTGDNELDAQMDQIEGLYRRIENLEDRFNELQDETNAVYKRERTYSFQMSVYGRISNVFKESHEGLPSSLSEPMRLPDVYGLCFALLYLIEIGDDIPWLYGACYGFMMEVCESLPWGMKEYDELDDPIWEYDNDEASVPKTAAIPDLNERKYSYKDSDYYFPRSLAQILYEETGCILPRDNTIYYPEYDSFRQYGIKGKDAGFMMLMSAALSTARRNIHATNLDPEAIRFLDHDPLDPLYDGEETDEGIDEDGEAEIGEEPAQPKDEKDILIDQLKEELKKSRTALHSAEVDSRNTRKELASTKSIYEREHRELADLREIVFNAQFADGSGEPEQPASVSEETYPYETAKRTTVFGGHDTFLKAIKPMLPNVRFIDSSYMTFSPELVRNSDIVWVQTNCISHPMFWNVVKYAKQYGVQLRYFLYASAEKCAAQVVEADKR